MKSSAAYILSINLFLFASAATAGDRTSNSASGSETFVLATCGKATALGVLKGKNSDGAYIVEFANNALNAICGPVFGVGSIDSYTPVPQVKYRNAFNFWKVEEFNVGGRAVLRMGKSLVPGEIEDVTQEGFAKLRFNSTELNLALGKYYYELSRLSVEQ